jgi:hypothetical protein
VAIDVLGGLDLAVPHLMSHLHVRGARRDDQGSAHMPQLMRGVTDNSIRISGGVALGER